MSGGSAVHTPGPWGVIIDDDGNPLSGRPGVFASDELDCGIVHWDGFVQEYWRSARGDKEIHANARLIAAAPELLVSTELLESLCAWLLHRFGPDSPEGKEAALRLTKARAAISKARGEQP